MIVTSTTSIAAANVDFAQDADLRNVPIEDRSVSYPRGELVESLPITSIFVGTITDGQAASLFALGGSFPVTHSTSLDYASLLEATSKVTQKTAIAPGFDSLTKDALRRLASKLSEETSNWTELRGVRHSIEMHLFRSTE